MARVLVSHVLDYAYSVLRKTNSQPPSRLKAARTSAFLRLVLVILCTIFTFSAAASPSSGYLHLPKPILLLLVACYFVQLEASSHWPLFFLLAVFFCFCPRPISFLCFHTHHSYEDACCHVVTSRCHRRLPPFPFSASRLSPCVSRLSSLLIAAVAATAAPSCLPTLIMPRAPSPGLLLLRTRRSAPRKTRSSPG